MVDKIPKSENDVLEHLKLTRGPIIPYTGGYYSVNYSLYRIKDGHIVELTMNERGLTSLPESIGTIPCS